MRCDLSAMTSNAQNKIRWDHFLVRNETDYAATPRSSLSTPLYDVEYCWWHMLLGTSTRTLEFFEARAPQHHHHRPCVGITATGAINRAAVVTIVQSRTIISFFLVAITVSIHLKPFAKKKRERACSVFCGEIRRYTITPFGPAEHFLGCVCGS